MVTKLPFIITARLNNFNWICGEEIKLVKKHLNVGKGDKIYWYITDSGDVVLSGKMITGFTNLAAISKVYRAPGYLTTMPRNIRALLGVESGGSVELNLTRIDNVPIIIVRKPRGILRSIEIRVSKELISLLPEELVSHLGLEEGDIIEAILAEDKGERYVLLKKSLKSLLKSAGRRYDPELTHEKLEGLADKVLLELLKD